MGGPCRMQDSCARDSPSQERLRVPISFDFYIAVVLVTGAALLLLWRGDRSQAFTGTLGLAHVLYSLYPLAYVAYLQPTAWWHVLGFIGLPWVGAAYLSLMLRGCAHLAGRRWLRRWQLTSLVGLAAIHAVLLSIDRQLAQAGIASLNTVLGLVVARWMWRQGQAERLSGVLLVLIGLNNFTYVIMGDAGVTLQASVAALLRLLLGLSLIHAALARSAARAGRMATRFFQLSERSPQGMAVVRHGVVAYANPAFRRLYGMERVPRAPEVFSQDWLNETVPLELRDEAAGLVRAVLRGDIEQAEWAGARLSLDGRHLQLRFRAWRVDWDGQMALQVVVSDETAQQQAAQALAWRSSHDDLTGLPNRAALRHRLQEAVALGGDAGAMLLLIDVDRFKFFNEAHNHQVGDGVLAALAQALTETLEPQAELMRLGADEFAAVALAQQASEALLLAQNLTARVRALLREPLAVGEHRFYIDVSMGVATLPESAHDPETLLQAAHAALHEAKRQPGTSVCFAADRIQRDMASFFRAEQAIRQALQHHQFTLVYQPKVAANTGRLTGFEALVRWDRPGIGRVKPVDFIPAAERTGLIVPLGAQVLHAACRQQAAWQKAGLQTVPVAVNVSALQLLEDGFPQEVLQALTLHALQPGDLSLEITESAAVSHLDQASSHILALRRAGVEVALDDFGTGFSSLNMLRSLPLHTVKIDRSLILPMPAVDAVAVVKAICDLAEVLKLDVVAEGVETMAHAEAAAAAGCHTLQGFHCAHPLEAIEAGTWLSTQVQMA